MRILSLGDLLLDMLVRYDPASGEVDVGADAVQLYPGGSAANFAVHAARLGAEVRFVSRVGRDMQGEMLVRSLESAGVAASVRVVEAEPTGRVLVMLDPAGQRRMWSYPGASATISPDDLDPAWFKSLEAFHLTGYSLLREGPRAAALEGLRLAHENGARLVTLDPNPPHLIEDYGAARFRDLVRALHFDLFLPNLEEGALLSGQVEPQAILDSLLEIAPLVALKLGEGGCIVGSRDGSFQTSTAHVGRVVDATGAGDAFAAGFVVEYLARNSLHSASVAANALAAEVVSRAGAR